MKKNVNDSLSKIRSPGGKFFPRGYLAGISVIAFLLSGVFVACSSQKKQTPAESLIETLESVRGKGILFGHQDDLAYGHNWKYMDGESDVKRVAGDYPAVFGWELGGLERGDQKNLDAVPFDVMQKLAVKADEMGGINTFCWHPYSLVNGQNAWSTDTSVVRYIVPGAPLHQQFVEQLDHLAAFFLQLKNKKEQPIPFIFRPWHEMNGNWFWWGNSLTSPEEYKALFRFTINYLIQEKGLKNMVVCYSPNGGYQSEEEYLSCYPGDDLVDILGVDEYEWPNTSNWVENIQKYLGIMIGVAQQKNKIAVISETGSENIPDSLWFTQKLGKAIAPEHIAGQLSYLLVWRNDPKVHHFFAYDGHPSAPDAKQFLDQSNIWLLENFKNRR